LSASLDPPAKLTTGFEPSSAAVARQVAPPSSERKIAWSVAAKQTLRSPGLVRSKWNPRMRPRIGPTSSHVLPPSDDRARPRRLPTRSRSGCPGSMPIAEEIFQEGLRIPPVKLVANGIVNQFRQGMKPHLHHDSTAVCFRCSQRDSQLRRNFLVRFLLGQPSDNFYLARCRPGVAIFRLFGFPSLEKPFQDHRRHFRSQRDSPVCQVFDCLNEMGGHVRFQDISPRPHFQYPAHHLVGLVHSEDQDLSVTPDFPDPPRHFQSVHFRHRNINDGYIGFQSFHYFNGLAAAHGLPHNIPIPLSL
jgi:hypothetical protein